MGGWRDPLHQGLVISIVIKLKSTLTAVGITTFKTLHHPTQPIQELYPSPGEITRQCKLTLYYYKVSGERSGQLWTGQVRTGQERTGQDRTGRVRTCRVRTGRVRTGQVRTG